MPRPRRFRKDRDRDEDRSRGPRRPREGARDRSGTNSDPGPEGGENTRKDDGLVIAGRNPVVAYLERMLDEEGEGESPEVVKIFVAEGVGGDDRIDRIKHLANRLGIPLVTCHRNKIDYMVADESRHQGVAAQLSPVRLTTMPELFDIIERERAAGRSLDGFCIVALDGLEDPRNVGAIIRSAEAQGARAVLIPERRSAVLNETVAKTSAGAIAHIPIVLLVNLVRALDQLKEKGFWVVGLDGDAKDPIYKIDLVRPLVLVVGSEGKGMRQLTRDNCDLLGAIPLTGKTNSLNAAVACGIALYETARQNSPRISSI